MSLIDGKKKNTQDKWFCYEESSKVKHLFFVYFHRLSKMLVCIISVRFQI